MRLKDLKYTMELFNSDELRINHDADLVAGHLMIFRFIDRDTKQHVIYLPSLELSGYGDSTEQASEMLRFSINDFFQNHVNISSDKLEAELQKFGWKHDKAKIYFSWPYMDLSGQMLNLNAESDSIEQLTLTAA